MEIFVFATGKGKDTPRRCYRWQCVDKPARLIIRLLFGFASDDLLNSKEISANTETAMLSCSTLNLI